MPIINRFYSKLFFSSPHVSLTDKIRNSIRRILIYFNSGQMHGLCRVISLVKKLKQFQAELFNIRPQSKALSSAIFYNTIRV